MIRFAMITLKALAQHLALPASLLASASISVTALSQTTMNGLMMIKPPSATYYSSCNAILAAMPASSSGNYTIDPDGPNGPVPPFQVYCDMTGDGGGWTLIISSNGSTSSCPVAFAIPTTTSAGILNKNYMQAISRSATSVRINGSGYSAISTDAYPINQLRNYYVLVDDNNKANAALHWSGSAVTNGSMNYSCNVGNSSLLSANIWQSCGNQTGFHFQPGVVVTWSWNNGSYTNQNINIWVR